MSRSAFGFEARRQWPLWMLGAVALAWFAVTVGAALLPGAAWLPGQGFLSEHATALFPPIIVLLLIAAFLPLGASDPDISEMEARIDTARRLAGDLESQLARIDGLIVDALGKLDRLNETANGRATSLASAATGLEVAAGTMVMAATDMGEAADRLAGQLPALEGRVRESERLLREAGAGAADQINGLSAMLAEVAQRSRDVGAEAAESITGMRRLLDDIGVTSAETTKAIANRAYTLDAAVTGVLERSAEAFEQVGARIGEQGSRLEALVARAMAEIDAFGTEGTRAIGQRLDVVLGAAAQLKAQLSDQQRLAAGFAEQATAGIGGVEARLEMLQARHAETARALEAVMAETIAALESQIGALEARQEAAADTLAANLRTSTSALETRVAALDSAQAEAEARMRARLSEGVKAMEAQLLALQAQQAEAGQQARAAADEAAAAIEARIATLQAAVAGQIADTAEAVDRAIGHLDRLAVEVSARGADVAALDDQVGALVPALDSFGAEASTRIPAVAAEVDALADRGRALAGQLDALAERIESQGALLRDAAAAFERDQQAVVALAETLAGHFEAARATVGDIHSTTEQTAIQAAQRMVENVMQVRQSVNATSAEIQALLGAVVSEAEARLDELASTKAEAAFGAPIRLQIVSLEEAVSKATATAAAASERLAAQLVDLMKTVAETEARVDEVDTRMDVRARDTLAARSVRLVERLGEVAVDVAQLLDIDVSPDAWDRYLKGDRGVFARQTVRLADRESARKIARHYQHDETFRAEAARYLDQFETLMGRVLRDPDGDSFATVLLSSDIGKLYVLLAQSVGRPALAEAA
ncbi:MAG: hypothetical protein ACK4Z0_03015 [Sphingomonadaceae bacterium]